MQMELNLAQSFSNNNNICRACLGEILETRPLSSVEQIQEQDFILSDLLTICTSIEIVENDGLPQNICVNCIQELQRSYLFKRLCENSDKTLRDRLKQTEFNQTKIVEENDKKVKQVKETLTRKSYNCDDCGKSFLGLGSYWKHMNSHRRVLKCELCNKRFKTEDLLKQHQISKHNDQNHRINKNLPRTCDICNKTFRFHSNLQRHKLTHTGERPFLCNVCGKGFGQMSYLKIHSFTHTGERPYKCQMCDKCFAAPGTLMTHTRIHTGERPHVCKICGKDFPQSGYLAAHIRTHTGEKPIECKVCHRRFNQSGRLIIHMRIHSGEKPFQCQDCGRCFAVKGTLKKHIRTHTGERPYVCNVCGQTFAQSGTLSTHMKTHRLK